MVFNFAVFDTVGELSIYRKDIDTEIVKEIENRLKEFESQVNFFDPHSPLSRLNREKVLENVPPFLYFCIEQSIRWWRLSGGLFDPTVGWLKAASSDEIQRYLKFHGMNCVQIKNNVVVLKRGVKLDFGGIAKGAALDMLLPLLQKIQPCILNLGGDLVTVGQRKWRIGIRNPSRKGVVAIVEVYGTNFICTSGNYERGKHVVDPLTGELVEKCLSVTVVADEGSKADALSTACFVAGFPKGKSLLQKLGAKGVFIWKDEKVHFKIVGGLNVRKTR